VSISTSTSELSVSSPSPFHVVITARILESPRPEMPITLMAYLNPFQRLPNRSIEDFQCVFPDSSLGKTTEIYPRSWPNYVSTSKDLRQDWPFRSVPPDSILVVKHEVPQHKVKEAGLAKGERYKVSLTDAALGTRWWTFGSLNDLKGVGFRRWRPGEQTDDEDPVGDDLEDEDEENEDNGQAEFIMGEDPSDLRLIIGKGEAEIVIIE
jgi:hypothetical protein